MNPRLFNGAPRVGALVSIIALAVLAAIGFTFNPLLTLQIIAAGCVIAGVLAWTFLQVFADPEDEHYGA